ncbi:MAG: methyltransferase domain-containing protein [Solirubrobacteraceae bacterium]|nr:methyltransferase domain-containing protein [Solirubrobacteraceae bacterium]
MPWSNRKLRRMVTRVPGVSVAQRSRIGFRVFPVSTEWGFDRGQPVDRYYIDRFLGRYAGESEYVSGLISGRILEIGGREYSDRFAPPESAGTRIDVLHENSANPEATIVGDLMDPSTLPQDTFDCVVCIQTLPVIWDVPSALASMHAALKPGGVLLATVPGITKALTPDRDHWGDWWRFTASSMRRLAADAFPGGDVDIVTYGNLLSATLFLQGFAAHEIPRRDLDLHDPDYEVTIGLKAQKAA